MHSFTSKFTSQSQIAVRTLTPLVDGRTVVLGIPGGPGISGRYMNEPVKQLALSLKLNGR